MLRKNLPLLSLRRLSKSLVYFSSFILFFSLASSTYAEICTPTGAGSIDGGANTNISFDLSRQPLPLVSCTNNPSQQTCFEIRGCNTGRNGRFGCLANSTFAVDGQTIDGTTIKTTTPRTWDLTFWLETWSPGQSQTRVCGNREWKLAVSNTAACSTGSFGVVGISGSEEIANYTNRNDLRLKFNGNRTSGFGPGGIFSLLVTQENRTVLNLGAVVSGIGMDGKLTYLNSLQSNIDLGKLGIGDYRVVVTDSNLFNYEYCATRFRVSEDGDNAVPPENELSKFNICQQIPENIRDDGTPSTGRTNCENCRTQNGIWTAIGCIQTDAKSIVTQVVQIGLGLAGGIALLMIIAAGFLLSTSQNDPKKVTDAKELVTSAIIGLLFIVFSVTILQFIGVTILRIPGFGGP